MQFCSSLEDDFFFKKKDVKKERSETMEGWKLGKTIVMGMSLAKMTRSKLRIVRVRMQGVILTLKM